MRGWLARRGLVRSIFEALLLVQLGHLGEHLVQVAQIHLLGWPPPQARGLVAALDVETVHFAWNLGVLSVVAWLLRRDVRSTPLLLTFAWAAAHTTEHGYLITRAVLSGVQGAPGIVGAGGLLARVGLSTPGLTTWTRPTVHLVWNVVEVGLLGIAYVAFAWPRLSALARRGLSLAPGAATATLAALVLASSATRADQPVTAHAPFHVVMDGRNELVGVAVAPDGRVYVSDRGAGLVYRLGATAMPTTVAHLDRPAGLAFTDDGRLLIAEEQAGRILRLEDNGSLTVVASGLKTPRWIATNDDGTLYVTAHRLTWPDGADRLEGRVVVRIDVEANSVSEVATGIRAAQGLTRVDGSLVVASGGLGPGPASTGALLRYPVLPGGALASAETWVGAGLKQPTGLALDALGAVYAWRSRGSSRASPWATTARSMWPMGNRDGSTDSRLRRHQRSTRCHRQASCARSRSAERRSRAPGSISSRTMRPSRFRALPTPPAASGSRSRRNRTRSTASRSMPLRTVATASLRSRRRHN